MKQTRETIAQNLSERLCWPAAHRDDSRVARSLYRKQVVDGVYQLDEGALLDDFFYFLHGRGWSTGWARSRARQSSARWCRASNISCSTA
jgi:hypothetical protein